MDSFTSGELWRVEPISGKDEGIVAKCDIKKGSLILQDKPLFIVPPEVHYELDAYLESRVSELNFTESSVFWSLADSKTQDGRKTARGIYFTNCYSIGQGSTTQFPTAMLPILAKVNHSCRPNAEFSWNEKHGCEDLRAVKDIYKGEELTSCYLDITAQGRITRDERRMLLQKGYGFTCSCEACHMDEQEVEKEDKIRIEAFKISQTEFRLSIDEGSNTKNLNDLLKLSRRWLYLVQLLGNKVIHQLEVAEIVWHLALILGEEEDINFIASEGVKLSAIRYGSDSWQAKQWRMKLEDPLKYLMG